MTLFQHIKAGAVPARMTVEEVYGLTAAGVLREDDDLEAHQAVRATLAGVTIRLDQLD
jgi:hypothetical protein